MTDQSQGDPMTACAYMVMCDRPAVALVDMSPINPELPICQRCLDNVRSWASTPPTVVKTIEEETR